VEFYLAAKDPFRVAPGNKIPVAWPYIISASSDKAREIVGALQHDYEKVLLAFGINLRNANLRVLTTHYKQPRETLIINTDDEDPGRWKEACTAIQELLDDTISRRAYDLKINAEIRNDHKMYRDVSSVIRPNTVAQQACMQVEQAVYEQVAKSCPEDWRAISYHMRGPSWQLDDRKPTIMIRISPGAKSFWSYIESQITAIVESIISSLEIELFVEILPGYVLPLVSQEMMPSKPLSIRHLPKTAVNGSSIGPRGADAAGTFGVWVDFQPMGNGDKQRCFLTCHHVIAPGDRANQGLNDQFGIGLDGRPVRTPITVDYPAPFDTRATQRRLQRLIEQGEDTDGENAQIMNIIDSYVSMGGIGSVIYSSGYETKNKSGRRMDWALVRAHTSSLSQCNKPPAVTFHPWQLRDDVDYKVKPEEVISKSTSLTFGDWVTKVGRGGVTAGEVNAMFATINWRNGMASQEIEIAALEQGWEFAVHGDSGSMVINSKKEWVGMVIGSLTFENHGIITSANELLDDIREKTGGSISLI
jgi:hypothetical protein